MYTSIHVYDTQYASFPFSASEWDPIINDIIRREIQAHHLSGAGVASQEVVDYPEFCAAVENAAGAAGPQTQGWSQVCYYSDGIHA